MSATTHGTRRHERAWPRPEARDRTPAALSAVAGVVSRFRFSTAILLLLAVIGLVMGAIGRPAFHDVIDAIGFDLQALKAGRLYVLIPGTVVQDSPWLPWKIMLLVAFFVPPLEFIAGSRRAAIAFFVTDWLGTFLSVPVLAIAAALGSSRADAYVHTPDAGSSSAAFGCISAFAAFLPGSGRVIVVFFLMAYLVPSLFLVKHVYSVEHLISAVAGFTLGLFWARSPPANAESIDPILIQYELGGAPRNSHGNLH